MTSRQYHEVEVIKKREVVCEVIEDNLAKLKLSVHYNTGGGAPNWMYEPSKSVLDTARRNIVIHILWVYLSRVQTNTFDAAAIIAKLLNITKPIVSTVVGTELPELFSDIYNDALTRSYAVYIRDYLSFLGFAPTQEYKSSLLRQIDRLFQPTEVQEPSSPESLASS